MCGGRRTRASRPQVRHVGPHHTEHHRIGNDERQGRDQDPTCSTRGIAQWPRHPATIGRVACSAPQRHRQAPAHGTRGQATSSSAATLRHRDDLERRASLRTAALGGSRPSIRSPEARAQRTSRARMGECRGGQADLLRASLDGYVEDVRGRFEWAANRCRGVQGVEQVRR